MYAIFMDSENSRTSEFHVLVIKLTDELDLKVVKKVLLYQISVINIHGKT